MTKEKAKHLSEVLKAYSEDKIIEYRKKDSVCAWEVYKGQSIDENYYEYRIKPEPKYRPYKNAEEFLKAQKEHGPYIKMQNCYDTIIGITPIGIYLADGVADTKSIIWAHLLSYAWQDGTPCGILEE